MNIGILPSNGWGRKCWTYKAAPRRSQCKCSVERHLFKWSKVSLNTVSAKDKWEIRLDLQGSYSAFSIFILCIILNCSSISMNMLNCNCTFTAISGDNNKSPRCPVSGRVCRGCTNLHSTIQFLQPVLARPAYTRDQGSSGQQGTHAGHYFGASDPKIWELRGSKVLFYSSAFEGWAFLKVMCIYIHWLSLKYDEGTVSMSSLIRNCHNNCWLLIGAARARGEESVWAALRCKYKSRVRRSRGRGAGLVAGGGEWSSLVLCSAPSVSQSVFTITEKAPTRAFSWLKAPSSAFTFKTLLRHYAKWALTPR